jgi:hypothetical protein
MAMRFAKLGSMAAALVVAAVGVAPKVASACAMCGLSPGDHAEHAFNTSVLFMLAGPYLTVGAVGGVLYFAWRRAHRSAGPNDIGK